MSEDHLLWGIRLYKEKEGDLQIELDVSCRDVFIAS